MENQNILDHIAKFFAHISREMLEVLFVLIVLIEWGRIPLWQWPMVAAALAYFISPIDAMPDPIFIDDAGVLAATVAALGALVTDDVRAEARARIERLVGGAQA
jgi:uncharacterized membrane protein YkvA (DUF1232 family)